MLGDYCIRYQIKKSVGEDDGDSIFNSMRIQEQIPRMYSPKSSVTMDHLLPKSSIRLIEALTLSMIQEQQDMETEPDDKTSTQVSTNTFKPSIPYHYNDPPDSVSLSLSGPTIIQGSMRQTVIFIISVLAECAAG